MEPLKGFVVDVAELSVQLPGAHVCVGTHWPTTSGPLECHGMRKASH